MFHEYIDEEIEVLSSLYDTLETLRLPCVYGSKFSSHARRTGAYTQENAQQITLSLTQPAGWLKRFHCLLHGINQLLSIHLLRIQSPIKFDMAHVSKNVLCDPHVDACNENVSILFAVGNYTGGQTILHDTTHTTNDSLGRQYYDISKGSLMFDAHKIVHETSPFEGNRYCIVVYKAKQRGRH